MFRTVHSFLSVLAAFSIAAPVLAPAQGEKTGPMVKVACVGDSITAGFGAGPRGSGAWPAQLRKMLGDTWDVRNFGVSGTTLMRKSDSPYQNQGAFKVALDFNPDAVVIVLGTNDTKPWNWTNFVSNFEADYRDMVRQFMELPGKPAIFVCRPPFIATDDPGGINNPNTLVEIPVIEKIAAELKLGVIDVYGALKDHADLIPDKVHPNWQGQTLIARAVLKALTGLEGDYPPVSVVLPSSEKEGLSWRYTTEKPADGWFKADFDASKWKESPAGFGNEGSGARTVWNGSDIWLRKEFKAGDKKLHRPKLWMRHDDDAEVYINGVLAVRAGRYNDGYGEFYLGGEAAAALKPGANLIAVHCRDTGGGRFIDTGLLDELPVKATLKRP